jgi:hypothetical protein
MDMPFFLTNGMELTVDEIGYYTCWSWMNSDMTFLGTKGRGSNVDEIRNGQLHACM